MLVAETKPKSCTAKEGQIFLLARNSSLSGRFFNIYDPTVILELSLMLFKDSGAPFHITPELLSLSKIEYTESFSL